MNVLRPWANTCHTTYLINKGSQQNIEVDNFRNRCITNYDGMFKSTNGATRYNEFERNLIQILLFDTLL